MSDMVDFSQQKAAAFLLLMQFEHDEALIDAQYQVLLVSMPLQCFLTIDDNVKHTSYTSPYHSPVSHQTTDWEKARHGDSDERWNMQKST